MAGTSIRLIPLVSYAVLRKMAVYAMPSHRMLTSRVRGAKKGALPVSQATPVDKATVVATSQDIASQSARLVHVAAGSLVSSIVSFPLSRVTLRSQSGCTVPAFPTIMSRFKFLLSGPYGGLATNIGASSVGRFGIFCLSEKVSDQLRYLGWPNSVIDSVASIVPAAGMTFVLQPLARASSETQFVNSPYKNTFVALKGIIFNEGVPGLYRASVINMARSVVKYAMAFGISGAISDMQPSNSSDTDISSQLFLLGKAVLSGGGAAISTNMFDVVKNRSFKHSDLSYSQIVSQLWKEDGMHGFFRGWKPNFLSVAAPIALNFLVVDLLASSNQPS